MKVARTGLERRICMMNEQENFWKNVVATDYIADNSNYDFKKGLDCWNKILEKLPANEVLSILELGCNVGRNLGSLRNLFPAVSLNAIEINSKALEIADQKYKLDFKFAGSIDEYETNEQFDLVFTSGVLIHIHPDNLMKSMKKMNNLSKRYVIMIEYFNRTPVAIDYRGEKNKLFKCNFGKIFIENFPVKLIDVGFLWGHIYDEAGFDDVTFWVFEKNAK